MNIEFRREQIVKLLAESGSVSSISLADKFKVSAETIRRDLETLEELGYLRRVHGGAITLSSGFEVSISQRQIVNVKEKKLIAAQALKYLPNSAGAIFLDSGTTTGELAELIPDRADLTVITNSVISASSLSLRCQHLRVILLGGEIRGVAQATVGLDTTLKIQKLNADVAFIGTNGFSEKAGYTTPNQIEAAAKTAMIAQARQAIVLADSDKYRSELLATFAKGSDIDVLITDARIQTVPDKQLEKLAKQVEIV